MGHRGGLHQSGPRSVTGSLQGRSVTSSSHLSGSHFGGSLGGSFGGMATVGMMEGMEGMEGMESSWARPLIGLSHQDTMLGGGDAVSAGGHGGLADVDPFFQERSSDEGSDHDQSSLGEEEEIDFSSELFRSHTRYVIVTSC